MRARGVRCPRVRFDAAAAGRVWGVSEAEFQGGPRVHLEGAEHGEAMVDSQIWGGCSTEGDFTKYAQL